MRKATCFLVAGVVALLSASIATAAPITYTHTGFGSGTLDGDAFGTLAPLAFTITATGDTDNVQSCGGSCLTNDNLTASITIDTLGTFSFLTNTRYFFNAGFVGFSRGPNGLDLYSGPVVGAWDMTTSIGPIGGIGELLQWGLEDVLTSGGVLFFNTASTAATFSALVGTTQVPEPGTLLLLMFGAAGATLRRSQRLSW